MVAAAALIGASQAAADLDDATAAYPEGPP